MVSYKPSRTPGLCCATTVTITTVLSILLLVAGTFVFVAFDKLQADLGFENIATDCASAPPTLLSKWVGFTDTNPIIAISFAWASLISLIIGFCFYAALHHYVLRREQTGTKGSYTTLLKALTGLFIYLGVASAIASAVTYWVLWGQVSATDIVNDDYYYLESILMIVVVGLVSITGFALAIMLATCYRSKYYLSGSKSSSQPQTDKPASSRSARNYIKVN